MTLRSKRLDAYAKRTNLAVDKVREFYEIEKELANRLRKSTRDERLAGKLYTALYDELFCRVPYHPLLQKKLDPGIRTPEVAFSMKFIERFLKPGSTFLEIGAGDCILSLEVAKRVKQVYAVDVSTEITKGIAFPENCSLIISDGISVPVPENSIDIAYSNQLMEHLHPDDAVEQTQNIYHALAPGGIYICCTPNRLSGPADVSQGFDDVATGFHLKEYLATELFELFRRAGFSKVKLCQGYKQAVYWETPLLPVTVRLFKACESILSRLPVKLRSVTSKAIFKGGGMTVIGIK